MGVKAKFRLGPVVAALGKVGAIAAAAAAHPELLATLPGKVGTVVLLIGTAYQAFAPSVIQPAGEAPTT